MTLERIPTSRSRAAKGRPTAPMARPCDDWRLRRRRPPSLRRRTCIASRSSTREARFRSRSSTTRPAAPVVWTTPGPAAPRSHKLLPSYWPPWGRAREATQSRRRGLRRQPRRRHPHRRHRRPSPAPSRRAARRTMPRPAPPLRRRDGQGGSSARARPWWPEPCVHSPPGCSSTEPSRWLTRRSASVRSGSPRRTSTSPRGRSRFNSSPRPSAGARSWARPRSSGFAPSSSEASFTEPAGGYSRNSQGSSAWLAIEPAAFVTRSLFGLVRGRVSAGATVPLRAETFSVTGEKVAYDAPAVGGLFSLALELTTP